MKIVPLPHQPLLPIDNGQTLATEHDEPLLSGFSVVVAVGLPRLQDVDMDTDARHAPGLLGPIKGTPHPKAGNCLPRHLSEVEDEPAFIDW
jgi:hypothetical protein